MDLLKDHIVVIPKFQSRFGNLQFLFAFVSWAGVIGSLKEYYSKDKANFNCNATADSSLINQLCYSLYTEEYNSALPQFTFALINGCVTIGIWIAFALYLGSVHWEDLYSCMNEKTKMTSASAFIVVIHFRYSSELHSQSQWLLCSFPFRLLKSTNVLTVG